MPLLRKTTGFVQPRVIAPLIPVGNWTKLFGEKTNYLTLEDTCSYIPKVETASQVASVANQWFSERYDQQVTASQIEIPAYLIQSAFETNPRQSGIFNRDMAGARNLRDIKSQLASSAMLQKIQQGALFGFSAGEGVVNGATKISIGEDGQGQANVQLMDTLFLYNKLYALCQRVYNACYGQTEEIVIACSDRVMTVFNQLMNVTASQKDGGGVDTIANTLARAFDKMARVVFVELPILRGKGTSGKDLMVVCAPKIKIKSDGDAMISNIDVFSEQNTALESATIDIGANGGTPYVYNTPLHMGIESVGLSHINSTGAVLRPEMFLVVELQYQDYAGN